MTVDVDDAPPTSRRGLRAQGGADAGSTGASATAPAGSATPGRRLALTWLDDDAVSAVRAPDHLDSSPAYLPASADLLARRPRRSPLRASVVMPFLGAIAVAGLYAASTLLWPLHAVPATLAEAPVADVTAPPTAVVWPEVGSAAVSVAGISGVATSGADVWPMASITKLVTALMVLEQEPLKPGESGPSFAFTGRDSDQYLEYLWDDQSALDVPVGASLSLHQMLQGLLIGSANNYADRLASTYWPTESVFASAATSFLQRNGLGGITVVEPTGIDPANAADAASLLPLARLALADPVIAEIVRTPAVDLPGAGLVENTNDLLRADPTVIGLKTGSLWAEYNLLAAKDAPIGERSVRVFASVLAQPDDASRDAETQRLLDAVAQEVSQPRVLAAGTIVGVVTTPWGATSNVVTDGDVPVLLWNGATATVSASLDISAAAFAQDAVGTVTLSGPLDSGSATARLATDLTPPTSWWRLTHPLELWGLAG